MRELTVRLREARSDGRTVTGIAAPWMAPTNAEGFAEQFARGAIDPATVVGLPLRWRHTEPIGAITGARDLPEGLEITARIADTSLGRDVTALLRELPGLGLSVRFREDPETTDWTQTPVTFHAVTVHEISLTDQPAYPDARVHHVREEHPMSETAAQPQQPPAHVGGTGDHGRQPHQPPAQPQDRGREQSQDRDDRNRETPDVRDVTGTDLGRELERLREQVATLSAGVSHGRTTDHETSPLARYRSLGDYALQTYRTTDATDAATRARALAEQLVADSPGVTQPTWLQDVKRIVDRGRPFITNLGGGSALPPAPEDPSWPYYDGNILDLVNEQAAELDEVTTALVKIKKATGSIKTYAGGSRASFQLLERSSPAYYSAYLMILLLAWARRTEVQSLAAAEAVVGATVVDDIFDLDEPATLFTAMVEAEGLAQDATGMGLDVVAVAPSKWTAIAGALDADGRPLFAATNPQNAGGVATARGAQGLAVAGIPLVRGAVETTAPIVATNRAAYAWLEEGPRTITQDQVSVLGKDVAIYGYGSPAAYAPAGVIKITPTP